MGDASTLSQAASDRLLAGIDAAFELALHGRYGGAIEAIVTGGGESEEPLLLRGAPLCAEESVRLFLQSAGGPELPPTGQGTVIGTVTLTPGGASVADVSIVSEIFEQRDVNEAADASSLSTGVLFARGQDGLHVVRSKEAEAAGSRQRQRQQRGWLPQQLRQTSGRTLGLSSHGHRRALPSSLAMPVTAELLTRLGGAVAGLGDAGPAIGRLTLVVQTGAQIGAERVM